jgi:1,5-anhydro-D-fructose reductase (1,5-anhydro-D-mannitol-forming)
VALGWGFISTGGHPGNNIAPALTAANDGELVAVYSRDLGRGKAFAEKHGAKAAYDSIDELLADSRVDAVFVSSPNHLHAQHGLRCAAAGKHVLMEKPMTTTLEDAVALVKGCRENGVTLGMGFMMRHHLGHVQAQQAVRNGALGRVTLAQVQGGGGVRGEETPPPRTGLRAWWEDPVAMGGASSMMGTGVHLVDLLRFVLGKEVTEVAAITDGQTESRPLEQLVTMTMRFDGGTLATMCCGRVLPDNRNDLTVYGINGRITGRATVGGGLQGKLEVVSDTVNQTTVFPANRHAVFTAMLEDFHRAIQEDREPLASGMDGLRVVEITLAMIESARHGRTVKPSPVEI